MIIIVDSYFLNWCGQMKTKLDERYHTRGLCYLVILCYNDVDFEMNEFISKKEAYEYANKLMSENPKGERCIYVTKERAWS